ncbi:histidine phosphatase family protein [Methyloligella sp. GL2]|nr:histidine phosphatase family protein [Methyloligella sp. GL2]
MIDLIRHGETETPGLLLGRTDSALSPLGWQQFARQTEGGNWPLVVSSPLARARAAAETLAGTQGLSLRVDEDWAELDFGAFDGRHPGELRKDVETAAALDALYRREDAVPPGGESWASLRARVERALSRIADEADDTDADRAAALVVTHGGPIRAAVAVTCNIPFAHLWTLRIGYGTRLKLRFGQDESGAFWGEIIEIGQP